MDYGAFHATNSDLVNLSNERGTAHVPIFASGGVHSAKPIPTGGKFQVKVLERGNSTLWIGFTKRDPASIEPVPAVFWHIVEYQKSKYYWMFCDSTAYHDGTEQDMSFSTRDLVKGDSVGVRVSENGDVQYYVNGQNKRRAIQHLPQHQDLWGVVFLIGGTKIQSEFSFGVPSLKDLCLRSCSLLQQVCLEQLPPSLVKEVEDVRRESST
jgi:hypothetical protein